MHIRVLLITIARTTGPISPFSFIVKFLAKKCREYSHFYFQRLIVVVSVLLNIILGDDIQWKKRLSRSKGEGRERRRNAGRRMEGASKKKGCFIKSAYASNYDICSPSTKIEFPSPTSRIGPPLVPKLKEKLRQLLLISFVIMVA